MELGELGRRWRTLPGSLVQAGGRVGPVCAPGSCRDGAASKGCASLRKGVGRWGVALRGPAGGLGGMEQTEMGRQRSRDSVSCVPDFQAWLVLFTLILADDVVFVVWPCGGTALPV